jgi:hypothetical protein
MHHFSFLSYPSISVPPSHYLCNLFNHSLFLHHFSFLSYPFISVPPSHYLCNLCKKGGHYIRYCPMAKAAPVAGEADCRSRDEISRDVHVCSLFFHVAP